MFSALTPLAEGSVLAASLASLASAALAIWAFERLARARRAGLSAGFDFLADGSVFLFRGDELVATSDGAEALAPEAVGWDEVRAALLRTYPDLKGVRLDTCFADLRDRGAGFALRTGDPAQAEVIGEPRGRYVALIVRQAAGIAEKPTGNVAAERLLEAIAAHAPVPICQHDGQRRIEWSNRAFDRLFSPGLGQRLDARPSRVMPEILQSDPAGDNIIKIASSAGKTDLSIRLSEAKIGDEAVLCIAEDISRLTSVEASLSRFLATLGETFAQLPLGLAIFDAEAKLRLFNPALADLTRIDPAWLVMQPSLRDFFEALRERQMIPEERDARSWRERLQNISEAAAAGTWSELWELPDGQSIRATGRPHPQDAIAFLFEDISISTTLERKYRREIERATAVLDRVTDAVATFSPSGALVYCNAEFRTLWDLNDKALPPDIRELTRACAGMCAPSPAWGDLREFVSGAEDRASWEADFRTHSGARLRGRFSPLPDGSTLVAFSPLDASGADIADTQGIEMRLTEFLVGNEDTTAQARIGEMVPRIARVRAHVANSVSAEMADVVPEDMRRMVTLAVLGLSEGGTGPLAFVDMHSDGGHVLARIGSALPAERLREFLNASPQGRLLQRIATGAGASWRHSPNGGLEIDIPVKAAVRDTG